MRSFETEAYRLIEDERIDLATLSYAYGATHAMARYCGFESPPYPPRGQMQHGWVASECKVDPVYVIWDNGDAQKEEHHWVSRKELETYLIDHGYPYCKAIGVGMVYQEDVQIPRLKNSLLVMPAHSLYTTEHDWDFDLHMQEIQKIREDFDFVTVCVHPACLQKGYWVNAFQKAGVEVVNGALFAGKHALYRMQWLMKRFEYMTTNMLGTHVAYAARAGTKISVYGKYIETKREDHCCELFNKRPELLDWFMELNKTETIRKNHGFLFCDHPKDGKQHIDWGNYQLGEDCKQTPAQLCDLFHWPRSNCYRINYELKSETNLKFLTTEPTEATLHTTEQHKSILNNHLKSLNKGDLKSRMNHFHAMTQLAQLGNTEACYLLSRIFYERLYQDYQNIAQAYYWGLEAAKQNHPEALMFCAYCLVKGLGVPEDKTLATRFLQHAASLGISEAKEVLETAHFSNTNFASPIPSDLSH